MEDPPAATAHWLLGVDTVSALAVAACSIVLVSDAMHLKAIVGLLGGLVVVQAKWHREQRNEDAAMLRSQRDEYEVQEAKLASVESQLDESSKSYAGLLSLLTFKPASENQASDAHRSDDIVPPVATPIPADIEGQAEAVLHHALRERSLNWSAAIRAATRIRDAAYSLRDFYDDCRAAFPELALYTCERDALASGQTHISSNTSGQDEYKRTVGALFAVYWLMRLDSDGAWGFSFGVDEAWSPRQPPAPDAAPLEDPDEKKRLAFFQNQDWARLTQLLVDAGMLIRKPDGGMGSDVERTLAMLALTAFHDVMKVESLLPKVVPGHAPYDGFKAGDVINDHDIALSYVLTHYSQAVPSFVALPTAQQLSIRFTQSKMAFNHGWLVQAEAPPYPLFGPFKQVITSGGAADADIAFYFVHWLTDLAGAVPAPLGGAEKFVLKFPHPVLGSFIKSFSIIHDLGHASETEVFEAYLEAAWGELDLGPLPSGPEAIALMRLVVQAQAKDKQAAIVDAFSRLSEDDQRMLSEEMARTGCFGQEYKRTRAFHGAKDTGSMGPAILVYYSPAFVRFLAPGQATGALEMLAEVYRRARQLWPLKPLPAGTTSGGKDFAAPHVTVRVDQIKELAVPEVRSAYASGDSWLLTKRNDLEAVVERHPLDQLQALLQTGVPAAVLKFWAKDGARDANSGGGSDAGSVAASVDSIGMLNGMSAKQRRELIKGVQAEVDRSSSRASSAGGPSPVPHTNVSPSPG